MNIGTKILNQFKQPTGMLGILAGKIMAGRASNIERNEWTLSLLKLNSTDRVLEIGFGPGVAIEKASNIVKEGVIVGIDHSAIMMNQASKRNAKAIENGRVKLYPGSDMILPESELPFDKIYSVNVVQFWPEPTEVLKRLRKMLTPDGVIATTYMPRQLNEKYACSGITAGQITAWSEAAGFSEICVEEKVFNSAPAISVLAFNRHQNQASR
ncbi:class I SAM-dependent methyltransferase [Vibrio quintilis]|uniref:Demethylrebeccamycin-D-glucose O-methyltransferase n=1 Tax=Vibrio quintilis TaxID=1117707 RepID=A0A1M7Z2N8_9VIBR|nr:class I SAM-dependent methyltransferase [Vibrio quintilis]SHO59104.1 Demethylrebeccamycin-D-glucose O-methyltransferase [Vibrio quintilis]